MSYHRTCIIEIETIKWYRFIYIGRATSFFFAKVQQGGEFFFVISLNFKNANRKEGRLLPFEYHSSYNSSYHVKRNGRMVNVTGLLLLFKHGSILVVNGRGFDPPSRQHSILFSYSFQLLFNEVAIFLCVSYHSASLIKIKIVKWKRSKYIKPAITFLSKTLW